MLSPGTALRDTCEREEAVQAIHEANRRLREAVGIVPRRREQKMHANVCAVHELCGAIQIAEQALDDEELAILLKPSYDLHAKSPFVRRLQIWPRGYPGDFETIEALLDGRPSIQEDDDAYWIDWYALNCAIACQHRNKVRYQAERVLEGLPPSPATSASDAAARPTSPCSADARRTRRFVLSISTGMRFASQPRG
jgi:hypothetical protein